jgi:hypothetical protein
VVCWKADKQLRMQALVQEAQRIGGREAAEDEPQGDFSLFAHWQPAGTGAVPQQLQLPPQVPAAGTTIEPLAAPPAAAAAGADMHVSRQASPAALPTIPEDSHSSAGNISSIIISSSISSNRGSNVSSPSSRDASVPEGSGRPAGAYLEAALDSFWGILSPIGSSSGPLEQPAGLTTPADGSGATTCMSTAADAKASSSASSSSKASSTVSSPSSRNASVPEVSGHPVAAAGAYLAAALDSFWDMMLPDEGASSGPLEQPAGLNTPAGGSHDTAGGSASADANASGSASSSSSRGSTVSSPSSRGASVPDSSGNPVAAAGTYLGAALDSYWDTVWSQEGGDGTLEQPCHC